jgi:hypothetical protein
MSFRNVAEKFHELLNESILRRFRSDVRIDTSLIGGLGSKIIVNLFVTHAKVTT